MAVGPAAGARRRRLAGVVAACALGTAIPAVLAQGGERATPTEPARAWIAARVPRAASFVDRLGQTGFDPTPPVGITWAPPAVGGTPDFAYVPDPATHGGPVLPWHDGAAVHVPRADEARRPGWPAFDDPGARVGDPWCITPVPEPGAARLAVLGLALLAALAFWRRGGGRRA